LTPRFSANRAVREYTEQHYIPAAIAYRERAVDGGALGEQIVMWQHALEQKWATLHFGELRVETDGTQHVFEVQVYLYDLDPDAVRLELFANSANDGDPLRVEMKRVHLLAGATTGYVYRATVSATRPATDYTARVIPYCHGVAVPLEAAQILWQR
jgi:glycogen phosphorylase